MITPPQVQLRPDQAGEVVALFCAAFADYPVMRFVLAGEGDRYPERLRILIDFFVMARALRGEPMLGIIGPAGLTAAATVSFPDGRPSPPALADLRESVWEQLGAGPRERYEACGATWARFEVADPHTHLNMIGVHPEHRGTGQARRLLESVQGISRGVPASRGVSLTTEDPRNVPIYQRCGYAVQAEAQIAPGLPTWSMFRPD